MPFASRGGVSLGHALGIVLAFNLALGAAPKLHAAVDASDELLAMCRTDSLPQDIRGSLSRNFSAWKIQEPTDLSVRARTRWGEERPLACPGIAAGHFQDPKSASYAVMLVPADHSSGAYKLLIYTQQSGLQFYGMKALGQEDSGASDVFVTAVPINRFFDKTSKWVAHSKVTEAVMSVDTAASQSFLYIWGDMTYNREQVNYQ